MDGTQNWEGLLGRIANKQAQITIVGLGYVGLPLAIGFAQVGFRVVGLEIDAEKVAALNSGQSYIPDVDPSSVRAMVDSDRFTATTDENCLNDADIAFICVPTPFTKAKVADISFIVRAAEEIAAHLRPNRLVVLQSTTHPGTTEEDVLPILERSGLRAGRDFYLAFCPERINPGDRTHTVMNTAKVVGGYSDRCSALSRTLFEQMTTDVFVVSSPRAAEMCKLLENIFRSVNIALVNELAKLAERMGIDIWEVIAAASTKPFGFMPFYPGPGVGGHCIAVDPYYLSWKAREYDFYTKFIELAAEENQSMPYHLVGRISTALNQEQKPLRGARILVLGVAFKKNIDDARNSPAERVVELLLQAGADIRYNDPFVPTFRVGGTVFYPSEVTLQSEQLTAESLQAADCVVIVAGHSAYNYRWILDHAHLVVDSCNATAPVRGPDDRVTRLGAPDAKPAKT